MAALFPTNESTFFGREAEIARFKARAEHFGLFVIEGMRGVGKTSLALRLANISKEVGCEHGLYLRLQPGETVSSIKARVEARLLKKNAISERSDPFQALVGILRSKKLALVLDSFENLRHEDVVPLVRTLASERGPFVVIAPSSSELPISAMLRQYVAVEQIGALNVKDLTAFKEGLQLDDGLHKRLLAECRRRGAATQALILRYLLALDATDLLTDDILGRYRARSENAFRALFPHFWAKMTEAEQRALLGLVKVGAPVDKGDARQHFGNGVKSLLDKGLIDCIDGAVVVHGLVATAVPLEGFELPKVVVTDIAKGMKKRAEDFSEPATLARGAGLLGSIGDAQGAVTMLADAWEAISGSGFVESYLKALASIHTDDDVLKERITMLSTRARVAMGRGERALQALEELAKSKDAWTKMRGLATLTRVQLQASDFKNAIATFKKLGAVVKPADKKLIRDLGPQVVQAMLRLGKVAEADKLLESLGKSERDKHQLGTIFRLQAQLARIAGDLSTAVKTSTKAASHFESVGEVGEAAECYAFNGDIHRESGEFDEARSAYAEFERLAELSGEQTLVQIASLSRAWVALDIGDISAAAQLIDEVDQAITVASNLRIKRYLEAGKAMLAAGRGHHRQAAQALESVVTSWEQFQQGFSATLDRLKAQLIRSLISCGKLKQAEAIVTAALDSGSEKENPSRAAMFQRENALLMLRNDAYDDALKMLLKAYKLFDKGGNRREAALTLHRIAHARLDYGDIKGARKSGQEALALAEEIQHFKAVALAKELLARLDLYEHKAADAVDGLKEAGKIFKQLGDELGLLHVSEVLLRAQIAAGEIGAALRNGPRVQSLSARLGVEEIGRRAQALTGAAAVRRQKFKDAKKYFEAFDTKDASALTRAIMWRLGEALALVSEDRKVSLQCRGQWVEAVRTLPERHQERSLQALERLGLPPSDRLHLRTGKQTESVSSERASFMDPADFELFVDVLSRRVYAGGDIVVMPSQEVERALHVLVAASGKVVATPELYRAAMQKDSTKPEKKVKALVAALNKALSRSKTTRVEETATGVKLVLPKAHALLVPTYLTPGLGRRQREIIQLLGRLGVAQMQVLQETFDITRQAAKNELEELLTQGLIEQVRLGRGQAFRLM